MAKILLADSGSTKTDWRLIDENEGCLEKRIHTSGINPYFMSVEEIVQVLKKEWDASVAVSDILHIYFYGAGCSSPNKCHKVQKSLQAFFSINQVEVNHDLLASARALFGNESGIAGILGTGSNSCFYHHHQIVNNISSLGYLFGDEGSGAQIGKKFIKAYLKNELPQKLNDLFFEQYHYRKEDILDAVYNKPNPNRFLAGFAAFVGENIEEIILQQIVRDCFRDYFHYQISVYDQYASHPLRLAGSIAFYFKDILKEISQEYRIQLQTVIKSPVENLVKYHLAHLND